MGRYIGASCRRCRAVGEKLFLKAKKCGTAKCMLERRKTKPGQHGKSRKKVSEYCVQLMEKQKLRNMFGMQEKQFKLAFQKAARMKGVTGENLLVLLERRLDNAVMRSGLAASRTQARQMIRHGHIKVNGKKVDIPSCLIKAGDVITVKENEKSKKLVQDALEMTSGKEIPIWINTNTEKMESTISAMPNVEDIDHNINVQLIIELYSK